MPRGNPTTNGRFQPGNQLAKGKRCRQFSPKMAFERLMNANISTKDKRLRGDRLCEKVLRLAEEGDVNCIKLIFDRIEPIALLHKHEGSVQLVAFLGPPPPLGDAQDPAKQ